MFPKRWNKMKKRIAAVIGIILTLVCVISGCSGKPSEKDIKSYIGEGQLSVFRMLINSNEKLVGNVFLCGHLPVDSSKVITKDGKTYAPVTSDDYTSLEQITSAVKATYATEAAEKLLSENPMYADIDGKLYFDMSYDGKSEPKPIWNTEKIKVVSASDTECVIKLPVQVGTGKKTDSTLKFVSLGGDWRLSETYTK